MKSILTVFITLFSLNTFALKPPTEEQAHGSLDSVIEKVYKLKSAPYQLSDNHQPIKIETKHFNNQNLLSHYKQTIDITGGADLGKLKDDSYYRTISDYQIKYDVNGNRLSSENETREYDEKKKLVSITTKHDFGGTTKKLYTYESNTVQIKNLEFKKGSFIPLSKDKAQPNETWLLNDGGQVKTIVYDCENCLSINYEYNDRNLVSKETFTRKGKLHSFTEYDYDGFDSNDNWTQRLQITSSVESGNKRVIMTVREIHYR